MAKKKVELKESLGLGDIVEKVASITGVASLVQGMFGKDCGCQGRKQKLNEMFPIVKGVKLNYNTRRSMLVALRPFVGATREKHSEIIGNSKIERWIITDENKPSQSDVDRLVEEYNKTFNAKAKSFKYPCAQCRGAETLKTILKSLVAVVANDSQMTEVERDEPFTGKDGKIELKK